MKRPLRPSSNLYVEYVFTAAMFVHRYVAMGLNYVTFHADRLLSRIPWHLRFVMPATILALTAGWIEAYGFDTYIAAAELNPAHLNEVTKHVINSTLTLATTFLPGPIGAIALLGALVGFIRRPFALRLVRFTATIFAAYWLWLLTFLFKVPSVIMAGLENHDTVFFDKYARNELWMMGLYWWLPFAVIIAVYLLWTSLTSTKTYYAKPNPDSPQADKLAAALLVRNKDQQASRSSYWAVFLHVFLILLLPFILRLAGCMQEPYRIPKGSGQEQLVQVKVKKKKVEEKIVFNMNSAISYYVPKLDETEVLQEIEEETLNTYEAGKLGQGKGGGYPGGMDGGLIRFIRLEYSGGDWDQQMGKGADYNFLLKFREMTGFKIAKRTESIRVSALKRFPEAAAPPFVYITGKGGIRMSSEEVKILRWYLTEEGGLLFADNGGGSFHSSFRSLMRRVFPDKPMSTISIDDPIYQQPFSFPGGAPMVWNHAGPGFKPQGVRHNGRWIVYYYPGDINDAWQTGGSGASKNAQLQLFRLGVNIVHYSFSQYLAHHGN